MSAPTPDLLELSRCGACGAPYLPTDGPCPRCRHRDPRSFSVAARGRVLAATELVHPASGWPSPHRLALVEVEGSVRLLALLEPGLVPVGGAVTLRPDGEVYRAYAEGSSPSPPASPSSPSAAEPGESRPAAGSRPRPD